MNDRAEEVERRLNDWVRRSTPEPPRLLGVEDVLQFPDKTSGRRHNDRRTWLPALASSLAVVTIAAAFAVVLLTASSRHDRPPAATSSSPAIPQWADACVPPRWGPTVSKYSGLSYNALLAAGRQDGFAVEVLCADGSIDIGRPPNAAELPVLFVALEDGRVIFARGDLS